MAVIDAATVKQLREMTGLGMMTCKKALEDANGDTEKAMDELRKQGQATAAKRAERAAKEGKVTVILEGSMGLMYEVNSETDFVARNEDFIAFVEQLGPTLKSGHPTDMAAARALKMAAFGGQTVETKELDLVAKIGEKINYRRFKIVDAKPESEKLFSYVHGNGRIGVLVLLSSASPAALLSTAAADLGKDLAMQVAAAKPTAARREHVSADVLAKEKEIYSAQAKESGKPERVWEKIVEGKILKYYKEVVLVEQEFIRDTEKTVTDRVNEASKEAGAPLVVESFVRFELGVED